MDEICMGYAEGRETRGWVDWKRDIQYSGSRSPRGSQSPIQDMTRDAARTGSLFHLSPDPLIAGSLLSAGLN